MDLNKCMKILSSRPACEHGQHDDEDGVNHARPDGRSMGQVIDLMGTSSDASSGADATGADETPEVCARRSVQKLEEGLKDMDAKSLVAAFRKAQEERALAYRAFDEGLAGVIQTGRLSDYNGICAEATASFAALSNLVNAIEMSLNGPQHDQAGIAKLLRKVQEGEKEKLSLTAALHLEKVRLQQMSLQDGGRGKQVELLTQGVKSLQEKIGKVVLQINEILEELRYEVEEL